MGDLYTVSVGSFFGCDAPSSTAPQLKGDVSIAFTCDPANKVRPGVKNSPRLLWRRSREGTGEGGACDWVSCSMLMQLPKLRVQVSSRCVFSLSND